MLKVVKDKGFSSIFFNKRSPASNHASTLPFLNFKQFFEPIQLIQILQYYLLGLFKQFHIIFKKYNIFK